MTSQSKIDDKRERILLAAKRLFVKQGIQSTPTVAIATEAGIANGTLFHYFKTKDILISSLYKETNDSFFIVATAGVKEEKSLRRQLRALWENTINWAMNRPLDYRFLQQFNHSTYPSQSSQKKESAHYIFFGDLIKEGKLKGNLKDIPVELLYEIYTHQIFGIINYLLQYPEQQQKLALMKTAFDCHFESISVS